MTFPKDLFRFNQKKVKCEQLSFIVKCKTERYWNQDTILFFSVNSVVELFYEKKCVSVGSFIIRKKSVKPQHYNLCIVSGWRKKF